jgi:hypothetical protein
MPAGLMLLFCGSSSILQFGRVNATAFGRFVFPGATILGLDSGRSRAGHAAVLQGLVRLPDAKTMILQFGNADLDFTYYRNCVLRADYDEEAHFARCIAAYNAFLRGLLAASDTVGLPLRVFVLAPQLSPLDDAVFARVTARHAGIDAGALQALAGQVDTTHVARLARTRAFNARLESRILGDARVTPLRIDAEMSTPDGRLEARFRPTQAEDHHAVGRETLKCWRAALSRHVEAFAPFAPSASVQPGAA